MQTLSNAKLLVAAMCEKPEEKAAGLKLFVSAVRNGNYQLSVDVGLERIKGTGDLKA